MNPTRKLGDPELESVVSSEANRGKLGKPRGKGTCATLQSQCPNENETALSRVVGGLSVGPEIGNLRLSDVLLDLGGISERACVSV